MATDIQLTGGSILMEISGKEFQASPLSDRDFAELDAYVKHVLLKQNKELLEQLDLIGDERKEWVDAVIRFVNSVKWASSEGDKVYSSAEGLARMGWQMIKKNHTKISFSEFKKLMLPPKDEEKRIRNYEEVHRVFTELNTENESGVGEQGGSPSNSKSKKSK